ncbi:hypothetical protein YPPY07_3779, partial [Yersinia pestis PY-07]
MAGERLITAFNRETAPS